MPVSLYLRYIISLGERFSSEQRYQAAFTSLQHIQTTTPSLLAEWLESRKIRWSNFKPSVITLLKLDLPIDKPSDHSARDSQRRRRRAVTRRSLQLRKGVKESRRYMRQGEQTPVGYAMRSSQLISSQSSPTEINKRRTLLLRPLLPTSRRKLTISFCDSLRNQSLVEGSARKRFDRLRNPLPISQPTMISFLSSSSRVPEAVARRTTWRCSRSQKRSRNPVSTAANSLPS